MIGPIIFIVQVAVLFGAFIVFDQLVRLEYSQHRKEWDADGQPHGFFWVPSQSKSAGGWLVSFRSSKGFHRGVFAWLFSSPVWMRRDIRALKRVYLFRALAFVWNFGLAIIVALSRFVQQ